MNHPTYEQQWQKITSAYLNDELDHNDNCACFVGNLLNNTESWSELRKEFGEVKNYKKLSLSEKMEYSLNNIALMLESRGMYTDQDVLDLEHTFLDEISKSLYGESIDEKDRLGYSTYDLKEWENEEGFEDALYGSMLATLEQLRKIHAKKGDETAQHITLQKRTLCAAQ